MTHKPIGADDVTGELPAVVEARIGDTIDTAVAAEAVLARNADNLTSGTVPDARIGATIARDSEVTAAVAAEAVLRVAGDHDLAGRVLASTDLTSPLASTRTAPVSLLWDWTNYSFTVSLTTTPDGRSVAACSKRARDFFDAVSTARTAPAATYYVATTGSDSNNGTSVGTPYLTIGKAITSANTGNVPTTIFVAAGSYPYTGSPSGSAGTTRPNTDTALIATGGRVTTGTWEDLTYTLDGTFTNCYTATIPTCEAVLLTNLRTNDGHYVEMVKVTSAAICNNTPGSWFLTGTTLYVHRPDGVVATSSNTRAYRSLSSTMRLTMPVNVFIGGADDASGFDFEGGTAGVVNANINGGVLPSVDKVLAMENSSARYGFTAASTGRGVSAQTWRGLAVFDNCDASANGQDGFNGHNANGAPARSCRMLTINCSGINNGRTPWVSNQGFTIHEDVVGIDLAGRYERSHGGAVRNIDTSQAWLAGTYIDGDLGDRVYGGTVVPTGIETDGTSELWADRVLVKMPSSRLGYVATATSKIHKRECWPTPQRDYVVPGATIDTY